MNNITSKQIHDALMSELAGKVVDSSWSASYDINRIFDRLAEENGYAKENFSRVADVWTTTITYDRYPFATIKVKRQKDSKRFYPTWIYKDFEVTLFYEQENTLNATTLEEFMIGVDAIIAKGKENKEVHYYNAKVTKGTALDNLKAKYDIKESRKGPILEHIATINGNEYLIVDYGFINDNECFMAVTKK